MIDNKIDLKTADKHVFLTHTFYTKKIGDFLSAYTIINDDVYFEMEISSRHFSFGTSLHDRNMESLTNFVCSYLRIEPNPDFIFKGKPIENERYLMYRYIKSIFQIPTDKLYLFSDDDEYKNFCASNNLEYTSQEWFKRIYIKDSCDKATEYLLQNSLIFQELYFPSNKEGEVFRPTLHDVLQIQQRYEFKSDFMQLFNLLKSNKINKLYHFTDKNNIDSIKKKGLLSAKEIRTLGICSKYASSNESRKIDQEMGLDDFVRLSFVKSHPMMFTSMTAYGLHPVILEINPLISLMPNVFFSNRNTLKKGANIGPGVKDLEKVDFSVVNSNIPYYSLSSVESKNSYQAEVLVRRRIGPEFIMNINEL
jgi:hypothetical protein